MRSATVSANISRWNMYSRSLRIFRKASAVPEGRVKPWGTGHAILSCMDVVDGPFAVINADDYYGSHAFQILYDFLTTHQDDEKYRYAMVGYELGNTLTDNGSVARGCCVTDENGFLKTIADVPILKNGRRRCLYGR